MRRCLLAFGLVFATVLVGFAEDTVTRSFKLSRITTEQATSVVAEMLGPEGSMSVRPGRSELIIQDSAATVTAIARVIDELDAELIAYRIEIELILATTPAEGSDQSSDPVDRGVVRMFPFKVFKSLGKTTIVGEAGSRMQTDLAGYSLSFQASAELEKKRHAFYNPNLPVQWRLQLEELLLLDPRRGDLEVLRTHVRVAPGQSVHIAASASENAAEALVLAIRAEEVGAGEAGG